MKRLLIGLLLVFSGCTLAKVDVEVLSERSALENQVLGSYNSLDQEMLLVASVRGVDPKGRIDKPPIHSQDHQDAVMAMQVISFHADDIENFKTLQWAGENNQGLLTSFAMDKSAVGNLNDFANRYTQDEFASVV